jgi:AcrR family transcriptional regulator
MAEKQQLKKRTRDKEAKITRIIDAMMSLIEVKGYDSVTSRDIAKEAGVSNGLVFKYFPDGKPAILKELGIRCRRDTFSLHMPDKVDFDDFPGFLRTALIAYIAHERKYIHLYWALTTALQSDKKLYSSFEEFSKDDHDAMLSFFQQFKRTKISRVTDPGQFIAEWMFVIDATIDHHLLYPIAFASDEKLVDMLVDLSLKLWEYKGLKK